MNADQHRHEKDETKIGKKRPGALILVQGSLCFISDHLRLSVD